MPAKTFELHKHCHLNAIVIVSGQPGLKRSFGIITICLAELYQITLPYTARSAFVDSLPISSKAKFLHALRSIILIVSWCFGVSVYFPGVGVVAGSCEISTAFQIAHPQHMYLPRLPYKRASQRMKSSTPMIGVNCMMGLVSHVLHLFSLDAGSWARFSSVFNGCSCTYGTGELSSVSAFGPACRESLDIDAEF